MYLLYRRGDLGDRKDMELVDVIQQKQQIKGFTISEKAKKIFFIVSLPESKANVKQCLDMLHYNNGTKTIEGKDIKRKEKELEVKPINRYTIKGSEIVGSRILYKKDSATKNLIPIKRFKTWKDFNAKVKLINSEKVSAVKDKMAWTGGDVTVGSDGIYPTWNACASDLGTFTSNGTATQISDVSDSPSTFNNDLNNHSLTLNGNGYTVTNTNTGVMFYIKPANGNIVDFKNFRINQTATGTTYPQVYFHNAGNANLYSVHNNFIKTAGATSTAVYGLLLFYNITDKFYVYNNITKGYRNGIRVYGSCNADSVIEGNTVLKSSYGINVDNLTLNLRDNYSFDSKTSDYTDVGSVTNFATSKNASSDTTGSETALQNLNSAVALQSTTDTDDNFVMPVKGKSLNGTGVNPLISNHTKYYNGVGIKKGDVDIGAKGLNRYTPKKLHLGIGIGIGFEG